MSDRCWTAQDRNGGVLITTVGVHRKRWQVEAAIDRLGKEQAWHHDGDGRWSIEEASKLRVIRVVVTKEKRKGRAK